MSAPALEMSGYTEVISDVDGIGRSFSVLVSFVFRCNEHFGFVSPFIVSMKSLTYLQDFTVRFLKNSL